MSAHDALADAVSALDFVDVLNVIKKTPKLLIEMGEYSAKTWKSDVIEPIQELRNCIMHSVRAVADDAPDTLHRLQGLDALLRELIGRAGDSTHRLDANAG